MCGIHAVISHSTPPPLQQDTENLLRNRGPDHLGTVTSSLDLPSGATLSLTLTSTVLSLRGSDISKQPLVDESTGSILCWNGEAWKIAGRPVSGSDTRAVFDLLLLGAATGDRERASGDAVVGALRSIEGPFAFIFFDRPAGCLYYGRDRLGRRSLLVSSGMPFALSSIAESSPSPSATDWVEVEADGCYVIDLGSTKDQDPLQPLRCPWDRNQNLVSSLAIFNEEVPQKAFNLSHGSTSVNQLYDHVVASLKLRVTSIPSPPSTAESDSRLAVLFSGGLDCTVLARLASDIVHPAQTIDLINVAFENPRVAAQLKGCSTEELYELCPDRITGRRSLAELEATCTQRAWRFVAVNVPYVETCEHRNRVINLIYPHNTEMDLSIGNALYFAARGQGFITNGPSSQSQPYTTTARVLLSGLGADELFGGYLRHRTAFSRRGYGGLVEELKLDLSRLGKRNLGRDDRVIAHWGKEARFPFLDEDLVKWAVELPAWEKCDFENDEAAQGGIDPEKKVLRLLAEKLGMLQVAREKKRAIQFGARTAKMESGRVKGTTFIESTNGI